MILWSLLALGVAGLAYITYLRRQPDVYIHEFSYVSAPTPTQRKRDAERRRLREAQCLRLPRELPPANSGMAVASWTNQLYPVEFERRSSPRTWAPGMWHAYTHERFYTVPDTVKKVLERHWHACHEYAHNVARAEYDAELAAKG